MAKPNIGYPLPDGDAYTDELACLMVFYPDKPEYRQAFFGAYFYFANWLAWERDSGKRGKDAAAAWRLAVEATMECIEMNVCEEMLSLLIDIRANTGIYCCDPADVTDGDQYTDEIEDGVGDVPQNVIDAGYATGVADWAGFYDYKCMISHVMITNMEWQTRKLLTYTDTAGAVIGGVAAVAAIAAVIFATGGLALVLAIVLNIALGAALYAAIAELGESGLGDVADGLETDHDYLACAINGADGSADAVVQLKAAIDVKFNVLEAAFLKNLNLSAQLKALYSARYDQQDIAEIMDDNGYDVLDYDCSDCGEEGLFFDYQFPSDVQGWYAGGDVGTTWVDNHLVCNPAGTGSWKGQASETGVNAGTRFTESQPLIIKRLKARFRFNSNSAGTWLYRVYFRITETGTDDNFDSDTYLSSTYAWDQWHEIEYVFTNPITVRWGGTFASFLLHRAEAASSGQRFNLDWIKYYSE